MIKKWYVFAYLFIETHKANESHLQKYSDFALKISIDLFPLSKNLKLFSRMFIRGYFCVEFWRKEKLKHFDLSCNIKTKCGQSETLRIFTFCKKCKCQFYVVVYFLPIECCFSDCCNSDLSLGHFSSCESLLVFANLYSPQITQFLFIWWRHL